MNFPGKTHHFFIKTFSTSRIPTSKSNLDWRIQAKQTQLVTQVSTILLQRHTNHWAQLFKTLNLTTSSAIKQLLTPSFYLQIFHKVQSNPQVSLNFFNWASENLEFKPDLGAQCKVAQILFVSGLSKSAKPILDSLIQTYPPENIVFSLIQACDKGTNFDDFSHMISSVLECYCSRSMYLQALVVCQKAKECGVLVSVYNCNSLLNLLYDRNEVNLAWCLYGCMKRNGIPENQFTWSMIAKILSRAGKSERILKILDMGIYSSVMYNLVIEFYSKRGDLSYALFYLDEMCGKKIDPSFSTYSSILDGACKYKDVEVIDKVMSCMKKNCFVPENLMTECDSLIQKLSDLGKAYAAELVYKKASDEEVEIRDASYGCLLRVLSKENRVKDAIDIYRIISHRNIGVNASCYNAYLESLCKENPSDEVSESLKNVIGRGFRPPPTPLSEYINSLCAERKWKQAEELLNIVLDKVFLLDSSCCSSLVKRYCSIRRIDLALALHDKMEKMESTFDIKTYNLFLNGLFRGRRVEETVRVFGYMRRHNLLSSDNFSTMIQGLCQEKKLREAMKLHDEMLKLGLKPNEKTYKRLISGFR